MRATKDGEFRSSVYTQRPPYADFDAPEKYNEYKAMRREQEKARMQGTPQAELPGQITWGDITP